VVSEKYTDATEGRVGHSQVCSTCDQITGPKGLSALGVRTWVCMGCGTTHDRDHNSAKNIERVEPGKMLLLSVPKCRHQKTEMNPLLEGQPLRLEQQSSVISKQGTKLTLKGSNTDISMFFISLRHATNIFEVFVFCAQLMIRVGIRRPFPNDPC